MDTRKKLDEARYFLNLLPRFQEDEAVFHYNLNAFLNAWRSVLDIMLYDFAEHYTLGFNREVDLNDKDFYAVAIALNRTEAVSFIKWWRQKQGLLRADLLWEKRIISFHRGNLEIYFNYYGYGTGSGSGTISWNSAIFGVTIGAGAPTLGTATVTVGATQPTIGAPQPTIGANVHHPATRHNFWSFEDFPDEDLIDKCTEGYTKLDTMVREAETTFHVAL